MVTIPSVIHVEARDSDATGWWQDVPGDGTVAYVPVASKVRVKPLVWAQDPDNSGDDWFHRAWAGVYCYEVGQDDAPDGWWWQEDAVTGLAASLGFSSDGAAKAAAQADYDARIMAALDIAAMNTRAAPVVTDAMVDVMFGAFPGVKFDWLLTRDEMRAALTAAMQVR